jgi:hypothetical protein
LHHVVAFNHIHHQHHCHHQQQLLLQQQQYDCRCHLTATQATDEADKLTLMFESKEGDR